MTSSFSLRQLTKGLANDSKLIKAGFIALLGLVVGSAMQIEEAIAQDRSLWLTDDSQATLQGYFLQNEDIFAFCDEDCHDIDLFLYNRQGTLIDSDDATDAFPVVTAPYDGKFSVKVTVPDCSHSLGCAVSISSDFGF